MSHNHGHRRTRAEELPAMDVEDSEPTTGDLTNSPSRSVDPQQSPRVLTPEHPDEPHAQAYGSPTAPSRVQSPSRVVRPSHTATQVPVNQASGKTLEPGNNRAHDKAAAKTATQRIIDQTSMIEPVPVSGAEEHARTTWSCVPGDQYSWTPLSRDIRKNITHTARGEQSDDSQPRHSCEAHTVPSLSANQVIWGIPESIEHSWHSITDPQSIDMNALREEIKETISATIKEKLCSDADSVTTVSQSMQALDANAQYWSDLNNKAVRHSRRALELQLKLAEEKVNNLLHEEAPEEALLEAAQEAQTIHFQLDQNS
ncbi:hypothetical protein M422DRAFT_240289 [Sphaerobolus stellatus SS14]|nr:hypothetical protein M422DRAFT_240289 [Sphaerobolus stellatus SS14]